MIQADPLVTLNPNRYAAPNQAASELDAVTPGSNCYPHVFVCLGCGRLAESSRSDARTCSPACRVSAHRHGEHTQHILDIARSLDVTIAQVLHAQAIAELLPDLAQQYLTGGKKEPDERRLLWEAYWDRVMLAVAMVDWGDAQEVLP